MDISLHFGLIYLHNKWLSYTLNQSLYIHSLYCRWRRSNLIETYKIISNQYLTNPDNIFTRASGGTIRGHTFKLSKPRVSTTIRQHFFNSRVINHWDNLPQDIVSAINPHQPSNLKLDLIGHGHS